MGSAFTSNSTYTRVVGEAGDAHAYLEGVDRFEVELRPLDAGDRAKLRDELAMEAARDGSSTITASGKLGTLELGIVTRALVSWSLEVPPTPATIGRLRPEVLEALKDLAAWGTEPQTPPTWEELLERAEAAGVKDPAASGSSSELEARIRAKGGAPEAASAAELAELEPEEAAGSVPLASSAGGSGSGS